jgi:hypothetical protein
MFVGVYVGYAHLASLRTLETADAVPVREHFSSASEVASRFEIRQRGGLTYEVRDGHLRIGGRTAVDPALRQPAELVLLGAPRRLADERVGMRFRVEHGGAFDVVVGFETVAGNAAETRFVRFGLTSDTSDTAYYRLVGDEHLLGRRPEGDGELADWDRRFRLIGTDAWHEVSLRLSPDLHHLFVSVDGAPLASRATGWNAGAVVRPMLGVIGRERGQNPAVLIDDFGVEPVGVDTRPAHFKDRFDGAMLDPARWRVLQSDGWQRESEVELGPRGLSLRARSLRPQTGVQLGVAVHGPTAELRSFRMRMHVDVDELEDSTLYFGISNLLFDQPLWHNFDIGVQPGARGPEVYVAGHWEASGQSRVRVYPGLWRGSAAELEIEYDDETGIGKAILDGLVLYEAPLDLEPLEEVQLHVGGMLRTTFARFGCTIREISFERIEK